LSPSDDRGKAYRYKKKSESLRRKYQKYLLFFIQEDCCCSMSSSKENNISSTILKRRHRFFLSKAGKIWKNAGKNLENLKKKKLENPGKRVKRVNQIQSGLLLFENFVV
jgi:hypothetical protein